MSRRLSVRLAIVLLCLALAATAASAAAAGTPAPVPAQNAESHAGHADLSHVSPDLHQVLQIPEHGRTYLIMLVLFQLAVILIAAKLLGWLAEKIRVPGVIGELLAGVLIGPYVLGQMIRLPLHGHWVPLFPHPAAGEWPVSEILWSFAQLASIVLLFVTGLHTDLRQFMRYIGPATLVALVGVAAPFALGVGVVYIPAFADLARAMPGEPALVPALFVGAILAATSIGITARVLSDIDKLDTPEGVTILAAAVLDDVLGIIGLAIVSGIAATGTLSFGSAGLVTIKAFGVWILLTIGTLALARPIERVLTGIPYGGTMIALALALAFFCSGVAEFFGLAFIIGAYSVGLGLSRTQVAHRLMDALQPISDFIVPIFFATLGMLVNFEAMFADRKVILFGLAVSAVAIIGKLVGCGLSALPAGFNARGAYRIGLGMMPRGEVALIIAGVGLSQNIIGANVFGVSIMMTLITTVLAPVLLVPAFRSGGSGRRAPAQARPKMPSEPHVCTQVPVPADLAGPLISRLLLVAGRAGWEGSYERAEEDLYLLRNGPEAAQVRVADGRIRIDASESGREEFLRLIGEAQQSMANDIAAATAVAAATPATPVDEASRGNGEH